LRLLQSLSHPSVVKLKDVVGISRDEVYMVFEYLEHDLGGLLASKNVEITSSQIKLYMRRLLEAMAYIHACNVLHRDVKGANILVSNSGDVRLADFGLADEARLGTKHLTNRVMTLCYRPPELLYGSTDYTFSSDMWSVGCIFGELLLNSREPDSQTRTRIMFHGQNSLDQLAHISRILGPVTWPGAEKLPWYSRLSQTLENENRRRPFQASRSRLRRFFANDSSPAGLDLLDALLQLDPARRPTAAQALQFPYFTQEHPPMLPPSLHPLYKKECHEYEVKLRRRARRDRDVRSVRYADGTAPHCSPSKIGFEEKQLVSVAPSSSSSSSSLRPLPPRTQRPVKSAMRATSRFAPVHPADMQLPTPVDFSDLKNVQKSKKNSKIRRAKRTAAAVPSPSNSSRGSSRSSSSSSSSSSGSRRPQSHRR
jgi:CTD kinase subunit alpha